MREPYYSYGFSRDVAIEIRAAWMRREGRSQDEIDANCGPDSGLNLSVELGRLMATIDKAKRNAGMSTSVTREIILTDYEFCERRRPVVTVQPEFKQVSIRFGSDDEDIEIANEDEMDDAIIVLNSYIDLLQAAIRELEEYHRKQTEQVRA